MLREMRVRTRTGIRKQQRDALLTGRMLEEALFGAIVARTRQAGEVYEQWDSAEGVKGRLRGQVEVEAHFAIRGRGIVRTLEELAAEGSDGGFRCHCHCSLEKISTKEKMRRKRQLRVY